MLIFKEWLDQLTNEDKEWIWKEYGKYDYDRAYRDYMSEEL